MFYEVRFHGRGGQGAVMAAQALAVAASHDGYSAIAFPFFGAERRGAPVLAFTRFGQERLRVRTQVYEPHYVVVLDESLIDTVDVLAGLRPGGMIVVNTTRSPDRLVLSKKAKSATVDATSIALEYTKQAAVNTAMLGAFAKATGLITLEGVEAGIMEVFGRRLSKEIADRNVAAARAAYEATRLGEGDSGRVYPKASKWLPTAQELPAGLATSAMETPFGRVGVGSSGTNRTGGWRVEKPVLDGAKCTNCLLCWFYCPDGSIARGAKIVEIHYDYCKGCGVCAAVCAPKAIHMERELEEEVKA
jgi:pyruvate ferredoxin oxidoreductase gamma subunit